MVYVIGFINSRLLGFCCFVALFLSVLLCYAYVVMVYGIVFFYSLFYCLCCLSFFGFVVLLL